MKKIFTTLAIAFSIAVASVAGPALAAPQQVSNQYYLLGGNNQLAFFAVDDVEHIDNTASVWTFIVSDGPSVVWILHKFDCVANTDTMTGELDGQKKVQTFSVPAGTLAKNLEDFACNGDSSKLAVVTTQQLKDFIASKSLS